MKIFNQHRNSQKGYSLIELSIVLVIIGIIGFFGIKFLAQIGTQTLNEKFKSDLQLADAAIVGFVFANGRLPCPATLENGTEDCVSNQGFLPVATLGIESSVQRNRGGQMRYSIYRNTVTDTDLGSLTNRYEPYLPNSETSNQLNGLDFCFALRTASRIAPSSPSQVNIGAASTNMAYAIADSGTIDANNNGNLFDGSNGTGHKFEKPNQPHNNTYDDNVKAVSFNELAGRLKCAKVLSETNGAARASYAAYDMWLLSTQYKNYRDFHVHYLEIMLEIAETKFALATAGLVLSFLSTGLAVANAILTAGTSVVVGAALAAAATIDAIIAEALAVMDKEAAEVALTAGVVQRTDATMSLAEATAFKDSKLAIVKALDVRGLFR